MKKIVLALTALSFSLPSFAVSNATPTCSGKPSCCTVDGAGLVPCIPPVEGGSDLTV